MLVMPLTGIKSHHSCEGFIERKPQVISSLLIISANSLVKLDMPRGGCSNECSDISVVLINRCHGVTPKQLCSVIA